MTDEKKGIIADPVTGEGDCRDPARRAPDMPEPIGVPPNYGNGAYDDAAKKKADGGGLRFNAGKNLMELVPPEWEWALADVTTQGSKKYEARNWERGMDWSNMVGCMKRHIAKFLAGERYDGPEFNLEKGTTGCHHLAMVAWNALALMSYDLRGIGNNNLPEIDMELLAKVNAVGSVGPEKETRDEH